MQLKWSKLERHYRASSSGRLERLEFRFSEIEHRTLSKILKKAKSPDRVIRDLENAIELWLCQLDTEFTVLSRLGYFPSSKTETQKETALEYEQRKFENIEDSYPSWAEQKSKVETLYALVQGLQDALRKESTETATIVDLIVDLDKLLNNHRVNGGLDNVSKSLLHLCLSHPIDPDQVLFPEAEMQLKAECTSCESEPIEALDKLQNLVSTLGIPTDGERLFWDLEYVRRASGKLLTHYYQLKVAPRGGKEERVNPLLVLARELRQVLMRAGIKVYAQRENKGAFMQILHLVFEDVGYFIDESNHSEIIHIARAACGAQSKREQMLSNIRRRHSQAKS